MSDIRQLCEEEGISRSSYYRRRAAGLNHEDAIAVAKKVMRGPYEGPRRQDMDFYRRRDPERKVISDLLRRWK